MFDGSYRSKPRTVNLGTNRGNSNHRKRHSNASHGSSSTSLPTSASTSTYGNNNNNTNNNNSNRDSILNEAHRLRMERIKKMQQNKAAIRVQQNIRGRQLRQRLLKVLYNHIMGDNTPCTTSTCSTPVDTVMIVESPVNHQPDEIVSKKLDMTTLLNIYFRLQQRHESGSNKNQPSIYMLFSHFSTHIQEHHHLPTLTSDDKLTRTKKILDWITEIMKEILFNTQHVRDTCNFVLQIRPNTFHIFKSILQLIPTLFVQQQQQLFQSSTMLSSSSSSSSPLNLSTSDIIIIMSYIMQLHQYPTKKPTNGKQEQQSVQSVLSLASTTTILRMMIDSLTFMIDRAGPQREFEKINGEIALNDDKRSLLMIRMFMMSCISTFIVNQPIMNDWCRPILGAVWLIYDYFHIDDESYDLQVASKFHQYLPLIMKVLRPIPPAPISSQTTGNTTNTNGINGSSSLNENAVRIKDEERFITQLVSQLVSHYRIPILVIVSRAISGETTVSIQNNDLLRGTITSSIDELHRTREQKEIMHLSLCVQFLKFLLLDTAMSDDNLFQQKRSDTEWNDSHNHFLFWMIQRAVRGDTSMSTKEEQRSSKKDEAIIVDIIDNSVLDNDEDMDQYHPGNLEPQRQQPMDAPMSSSAGTSRTAAPVTSSTSNPHRRLTKHDLQTLPKIDKKLNDIVKSIDHMFELSLSKRKSNDDTLQVLVEHVCDPKAWLRWGNALMSNIADYMDDDFYSSDDDMEFKVILRHGQDDYITLLALFLQATTSLRTQTNALSSTYLKVLPYSSMYMSNLWKYILRQLQVTTYLEHVTTKDLFLAPQSFLLYDVALQGLYYSMLLFSDLFAHHLIAINDEQFVSLYTKLRPVTAGDDEQIILVDDVIVRMRTILNELYWTKPVCASDLKLILSPGLFHYLKSRSSTIAPLIATSKEDCTSFVRARLLLTGTKLYNTLYERWCRLVAFAPFCDESLWWFPAIESYTMVDNLIIRDDDIENTTTERIRINRHQQQTQTEMISETTRNEVDDPMDLDDSSSEDENERNRPHIDEESDRLAAVFSDPKMARLLGSIPQVIPFDRRVKMFDSLIRIDKLQSQDEASDVQRILNAMIRGEEGDVPGRKSVKIRRDELYSDSMEQLNHLGPKLKGRVHVSFTNQVGTDEAGIDGGGVFREFIDDLISDAFSVGETTAGHNLFAATPNQTLTVNIELLNNPELLSHYEFLGRVLGKAVYESILVEAQFCVPFLNQMLGKTNTLEDLKNLDAEYYTNLRKLLSMSKSDIESLGLTFEMTIATKSSVKSIELLPNGSSISVTKANVVQYVLLVSHHRLNVLTFHQTRAFLQGFRDLVPASWVRLFSAHELQKVISGDDSIQGIDVPSLKKVMQYAAGYHPSQSIIEWFWEIIEEMTADQQRKFLKFMTSCSRQPLLGFGSLEPAPCIQQIRLPDSLFASQDDEVIIKEAPLPTSSTCMNLFKLPNYQSKEIMRRKVLAAIESGAGFELT